jgi:hypothetical protein
MLKIKDWLLGQKKQFEILEVVSNRKLIKSIKRLNDGKVFERGTYFDRVDFRIFLFIFSEDQIHVNVSVTKKNSSGVVKNECGFNIPVNELETWIPKLEEDVED